MRALRPSRRLLLAASFALPVLGSIALATPASAQTVGNPGVAPGPFGSICSAGSTSNDDHTGDMLNGKELLLSGTTGSNGQYAQGGGNGSNPPWCAGA